MRRRAAFTGRPALPHSPRPAPGPSIGRRTAATGCRSWEAPASVCARRVHRGAGTLLGSRAVRRRAGGHSRRRAPAPGSSARRGHEAGRDAGIAVVAAGGNPQQPAEQCIEMDAVEWRRARPPARCRDRWPRTARASRAAPARSRDRRAARHLGHPPIPLRPRQHQPPFVGQADNGRQPRGDPPAWNAAGIAGGVDRQPRMAPRERVEHRAFRARPTAARRARRSIGPVSITSTAPGPPARRARWRGRAASRPCRGR